MSKALFDAIKRIKGKPLTQADVDAVNAVLNDSVPVAIQHQGRRISQRGIDLIHSFETLKLTAYADPGSVDGLPVTNGWGTTIDEDGGKITLGEVWDKAKADRLFERDMVKYTNAVDKVVSAHTNQNQFDALVSFAYNVGTGALRDSTLLRFHNAGDYEAAAAQFARWNKNDGRAMKGLTRRRAAEAALYRSA